MTGYFEVDPSILEEIARRLVDSVEVAGEVKDKAGAVRPNPAEAGHEAVSGALDSFLDKWAYGCACLEEDAKQMAARLSQTSKLYLETELAIAGGFSRVG